MLLQKLRAVKASSSPLTIASTLILVVIVVVMVMVVIEQGFMHVYNRATADNEKYRDLVNWWIAERYTLRYTGGLVPDVYHIFIKVRTLQIWKLDDNQNFIY